MAQQAVNPSTHFNYQTKMQRNASAGPQPPLTPFQHGRPSSLVHPSRDSHSNNDPFFHGSPSVSLQLNAGSSRMSPHDPFLMTPGGPATNPYSSPAASYMSDTPTPFTNEMVHRQQAELGRMTQENQKLQHELQEQKLKNKLKTPTAINDTDGNDGKRRLRHIAQSFALTHNLWIRSSPEDLAAMILPTTYNPSSRFSPNIDDPGFDIVQHELNGVLYEFQLHLKEVEQVYAKSGITLRTIFNAMSDYRSELQNNVRTHASELLKDYGEITKDDVQNIKDHNYRLACPRFKALLGFNPNPTKNDPEYPLIPPILSQGGTGLMGDLFRNSIHRKVLAMLLLGPAKMAGSNGRIPANSRAALWGVSSVTIGMIAASGVLVQWMISGDKKFTGVGTVTRIDYKDRFCQYKTILGQNFQSPDITDLINILNQELFGIVPTSVSSPRTLAPPVPSEDVSLTRLLLSTQIPGDLSTRDTQMASRSNLAAVIEGEDDDLYTPETFRSPSNPLNILAEDAAARATQPSPQASHEPDTGPVEQITTHALSRFRRRDDEHSFLEEDDPDDELNADGSSRTRKKRKTTRQLLDGMVDRGK